MTKFLLAAALLLAAPAFAQQQATQPQPEGTEGSSKNHAACQQADATKPATPPSTGPSSGTAPGNAGSTGWTGGTGGSHTGTTPGSPGADIEQPAVAAGLDLSGTTFENAQQRKC